MYNIGGLGRRIAAYRRLVGLTQEELASKLGITAQAVSKWENELSFPEITVFPALARELSVTIEQLFGKEELNSLDRIPSFPEVNGANLRLVHSLEDVACYSTKDVEITTHEEVVFRDGSRANLRQLLIINKGPGEVCFDFQESGLSPGDLAQTQLSRVFDEISSVDVNVGTGQYTLVRSEDNRTHVRARGTADFLSCLSFAKAEGLLSVMYRESGGKNQWGNQGNQVVIALGQDQGDRLQVTVNGSGSMGVHLPFTAGSIVINGSGTITLGEVHRLECQINGSGDIQSPRVAHTQITINGSGNVTIGEVSHEARATINGSGKIELARGCVETFAAAIYGSGDVRADRVCADTADLDVQGSGAITLGRVVDQSVERHSRNSKIAVLRRG